MQSALAVDGCLGMCGRLCGEPLSCPEFLLLQENSVLGSPMSLDGPLPTYRGLDRWRRWWEFGIALHLLPIDLYTWLELVHVHQRSVKANVGGGGRDEPSNCTEKRRGEQGTELCGVCSFWFEALPEACEFQLVFMKQPLY